MNRLIHDMTKRPYRRQAALVALLMLTSACTSVGPGSGRIVHAPETSSIQGIQVVNLDDSTSRYLVARKAAPDFSDVLGQSLPMGQVVGIGDTLQITVWEAPPAVLFSTVAQPTSLETGHGAALPDYLVGASGRISMPFAGTVPVAGRTLTQIEQDITARLRQKAHLPQVTVRLSQNATANVSVVGEVTNSVRLPLTPKGETILDALAAAGGTRQLSDKITIQVSRDGKTYLMPLQAIIRDPRQNVVLRAGDVVTALFQPYSFSTLGAVRKNEEIPFEATGFTLAQALGRAGGLLSADPKGVFIFRWEDPATLPEHPAGVGVNADGKIPVIYRVNMKNPTTYFTMQNFAIQDKDVIYIANSPISEFQRFVGIMASTVLPVIAVDNALSNN